MFGKLKNLLFVGLAFVVVISITGNALAKDLVFGMTGRDMTPPYARAMEAGAEKKAKELGVKLVAKDSQNDVLKQLAHMDSFLVMGVDGLLFEGTIDTRAVVKGIKKFKSMDLSK